MRPRYEVLNIELVRQKMKEKGYKLRDLAEKANVSISTVWSWLHEESVPQKEHHLKGLAEALDVSVEELIVPIGRFKTCKIPVLRFVDGPEVECVIPLKQMLEVIYSEAARAFLRLYRKGIGLTQVYKQTDETVLKELERRGWIARRK